MRLRLEPSRRLDVALALAVPTISRSQWAKHIRAGRVFLDGSAELKAAQPVETPVYVEVFLPQPPPGRLQPAPLDFDVLYEDADLIVVAKPAGLVVHPGVQNEPATLVHGLLHRFPDLARTFGGEADKRPGIVHRLDRGTSGVLVIARSAAARLDLIRQFSQRQVHKQYVAWVFGRVLGSGTWTGPIGRHPRERKRFAVIAAGKPAETRWRATGTAVASTRLELELISGRTHQIRVHAHHAGLPLLGDPTYRKRGRVPACLADWGPERDRPALHAARIVLRHPASGKVMEFQAPFPPDLADLDRRYDPV